MDSCRGQYLDGSSPVAREGELSFDHYQITFISDDGGDRIYIPYEQVEKLERNGERCVMSIKNPEGIAPQVRFEYFSGYAALEEKLLFHTNRSWLLPIKQAPFWAKCATLLLLCFSGGWLFLASTSHWHLLVSPKTDKMLGDFVEERILNAYRVKHCAEMQTFLGELNAKLASIDSVQKIRIHVIEDDTINAFALPNGSIFFFTGFLKNISSAEELAGVLAHEIAHVEARHSMRQICQTLGTFMLIQMAFGADIEMAEMAEGLFELAGGVFVLKYSKDHEREADEIGAHKMLACNYDLQGLIDFFEKTIKDMDMPKSLAWLSTHPLHGERITNLKAHAKGQKNPKPIPGAPADWQAFVKSCEL